jgi:hypothetical protein
MTMTWYLTAVYYFGIFDAGTILIAGVFLAFVFLSNVDATDAMSRIVPAIVSLVFSNAIAMVVLGITRWWIS